MADVIWDRPADGGRATVVLGHGAGAPMDSAFMNRLAAALAAEGLAVARFEFAYMAARRDDGRKRPAPKAETLVGEYATALAAILAASTGPVVIGGKSMGGRVAAMLSAAELDARVIALACFGYPFHPIGEPERLRRAPIDQSRLPVLILQGERDEFGNRDYVEALNLDPAVRLVWLSDGNHDFGPRGRAEATLKGNIAAAAAALAGFVDRLLA